MIIQKHGYESMERPSLKEIKLELLQTLEKAQKDRDKFPGTEWIQNEIDVMARGTNKIRRRHGLSEVPVSLIDRMEAHACGHADYSSKFALYCAEVALGISAFEKRTS